MRRLLPLFLALAAACNSDFERQSQIERVRVLAVKSTPAELPIPPEGQFILPEVQLETLAVAPDARPLTVELALCRPGNVYAADFACPGADGLTLPDGKLSVLDPAVQAFFLNGATPAAGPGGALPGLDDAALEKGFQVFIGYRVSDGSGTPEGEERGVRRLTVRRTATPNGNPELTDVKLNGATLQGPLALGERVTLEPVLADGSQEPFIGSTGPATETIAYSWHASGNGLVEFFRSLDKPAGEENDLPTTEYVAAESAESVTFYVVARDGRGGTDWLVRTVEVR